MMAKSKPGFAGFFAGIVLLRLGLECGAVEQPRPGSLTHEAELLGCGHERDGAGAFADVGGVG